VLRKADTADRRSVALCPAIGSMTDPNTRCQAALSSAIRGKGDPSMAKLMMQGTSPPTGCTPNSSDGKRVLTPSLLAMS
jgi:hypothetical protein